MPKICSVRKSHYNRKARYNLTPEEYTKLLAKQKCKCAICGKLRRLCVDHEHNSNRIRGLLCHACNCMLGYAFDEPSTLKSAIRYLKRNKK